MSAERTQRRHALREAVKQQADSPRETAAGLAMAEEIFEALDALHTIAWSLHQIATKGVPPWQSPN